MRCPVRFTPVCIALKVILTTLAIGIGEPTRRQPAAASKMSWSHFYALHGRWTDVLNQGLNQRLNRKTEGMLNLKIDQKVNQTLG